jgi:hypothetical protein
LRTIPPKAGFEDPASVGPEARAFRKKHEAPLFRIADFRFRIFLFSLSIRIPQSAIRNLGGQEDECWGKKDKRRNGQKRDLLLEYVEAKWEK